MEGQANSQGYRKTQGAFSSVKTQNCCFIRGSFVVRQHCCSTNNQLVAIRANQVESMKQIAKNKANEERKRLESEVNIGTKLMPTVCCKNSGCFLCMCVGSMRTMFYIVCNCKHICAYLRVSLAVSLKFCHSYLWPFSAFLMQEISIRCHLKIC